MKRLELLFLLLEKEQKLRDEARDAMRVATKALGDQQAQSQGLADYRVEYAQKWSARFQQGTSIEILRAYAGFNGRLEQAITQQQAVVAHAQRRVDAAREALIAREVRVATVERLIERRQALLARVQSKRDQKNLDEMAARRVVPKHIAGLA